MTIHEPDTETANATGVEGEGGRGGVGGRGRGRGEGSASASAASPPDAPPPPDGDDAAAATTIRRGLDAISRIERAADHGGNGDDDDDTRNGGNGHVDNGDNGRSAEKEKRGGVGDGNADAYADGDDGEDDGEGRRPAAAPSIEWMTTIELDYAADADETGGAGAPSTTTTPAAERCRCFNCGTPQPSHPGAAPFSRCGKCRVARYCSRDCQVADYKRKPSDPHPPTGGGPHYSGIPNRLGHKRTCAAYSRVGPSMRLTDDGHKRSVREEVVGKIRFYSSPYAVHHTHNRGLGRGFLFLQSGSTLAELSLPNPIGSDGCVFSTGLPRSVVLNYLTMGEYDSELCRDDFEMASVRGALTGAVESYDDKTEVVYLMKFRCGHVAVGRAPMVPDLGICKSLAKDYFGGQRGGEALQLNLDDM